MDQMGGGVDQISYLCVCFGRVGRRWWAHLHDEWCADVKTHILDEYGTKRGVEMHNDLRHPMFFRLLQVQSEDWGRWEGNCMWKVGAPSDMVRCGVLV